MREFDQDGAPDTLGSTAHAFASAFEGMASRAYGAPESTLDTKVHLFEVHLGLALASRLCHLGAPSFVQAARAQVARSLAAFVALSDFVNDDMLETRPESSSTPHFVSPTAENERTASLEPAEVAVLANIATFHRAHERYYSHHLTSLATDLYREANRLRIVADVWLAPSTWQAPAIDFQDDRYRVAGCPDLNALDAIPMIGILFMEGEGPPSELRALQGKLKATAAATSQAGAWLFAKMEAAWPRERAILETLEYRPARARVDTIVANWLGARRMQFAARLLETAAGSLGEFDLSPAAIRRDRIAAARNLLDAAAHIAAAAQLEARLAADLADNDARWESYLKTFESAVSR